MRRRSSRFPVKQSPSRKRGEMQRDVVSVPELRREVAEQKADVAQVKEQAQAQREVVKPE